MHKRNCKACGAKIFFIRGKNRSVPLDAKPKKVYVKLQDKNGFEHWYLKEGFESHFANCPNAEDFRQAKKKQGCFNCGGELLIKDDQKYCPKCEYFNT